MLNSILFDRHWGELVYRLKYRADRAVIPNIIEVVIEFVNSWGIRPDVIVPMPPSKRRAFQPVIEISSELAKALGTALNTSCLRKTRSTAQMKDIGDFGARVTALEGALTSDDTLAGKEVLLIDDLFQSGASMNVAARILKHQGAAKLVYALALTRTRN